MSNTEQNNDRRVRNEDSLTLDEVISTQPELGPSIPDGGFGWIIFIATLFFQILMPCLLVNFGVFLGFTKLENGTADDKNILLWDSKFIYVPLLFCLSRRFFDPFARAIATTTSPRLFSVVGTCLTCAGLLFVWMGMTGYHDEWLYAPAGLFSGIGATIILVQCEILLSQYFRLKLYILTQLSSASAVIGFIIAPVILGHHILNTTLTHVLLWYQAVILQGLVVSLVFSKPPYLKPNKRKKPYQFISSNPDDEEDILSKNARELQIRGQGFSGKIALHQDESQPGPSGANQSKKWVQFEDEKDPSYAKLDDWEVVQEAKANWERFDDDAPPSPRINHLSLAEETNTHPTTSFNPIPTTSVYTYDEDISEINPTDVFATDREGNEHLKKIREVLKEPTFYKSLFMVVGNTYSSFVFYALYPSYLYIEAESVNIRQMTELVGVLSLVSLVYLCVAYWVKVGNGKRPVCFWVGSWLGTVGYFMIADFTREYLLLLGGFQVVLSMNILEHYSQSFYKIPLRGGTSSENFLLSTFSALFLLVFLVLDASFKTCFRLVAVFHFFSGALWLANFAYKKLRVR